MKRYIIWRILGLLGAALTGSSIGHFIFYRSSLDLMTALIGSILWAYSWKKRLRRKHNASL